MPESTIAGVPVNFPFEPYEVQRVYMEKVIMCLRDGTNGVLESPTGTGKTLSLLCSSLAWLLSKKQEMKAKIHKSMPETNGNIEMPDVLEQLEINITKVKKANWGVPKIIYASRTHSQLTQAVQELKRTFYSFMKAVVLGSRDQLCIHPDVMREQGNANKIQMCKLRVQTRTCSFFTRVESRKDDPDFKCTPVMDIEDLIKVGQKLKMCPYYASKELVEDADIIFMPYNYLLDPSARKANKIELSNAICILDEAHNIEKICEESASVQIKSSDVAMAIEDATHIMKAMSSGEVQDGDEPKDFTLNDLVLLKEMLLEFEKAIDDIVIENKQEGATFPASFIFDLLAKANISYGSSKAVIALLEKLMQFMAVESQNNHLRKGGSYQKLSDFLTVVFCNKEDVIQKVYRSFKVHVQIEEPKQQYAKGTSTKDGWISKGNITTTNKAAKVINYWCFNPGFGMEQLLNTNVRSVILTSGTLAPLKPLIAELSIPIAQSLENPHIVQSSQVYVKIIGSGPDREQLISNYQNRDNPKYISSLGSTILNVARIVPDGLLVFFPSYPLLNQCINLWQASGLWADILRYKPIFVEPRNKDDFVTTMESFYQSINDSKGACFMAVCRGKVSEGLDFADRNGRAVIITGLPFPPLKDPKVILKKKYLEDNRTKENELLSGQAWYALDATRAVNQAIGRVIRHRNDYGAILLCDVRFQQSSQVQQLSKWIRDILGSAPKSSTFGPVIKELKDFFKNAEKNMPKPKERFVDSFVNDTGEEASAKVIRSEYFTNSKEVLAAKMKFQNAHSDAIKIEKANSIQSWSPNDYAMAAGRSRNGKLPSAMDFISRLDSDVSAIDFNSSAISNSSSTGLVKIHKRERSPQFSLTPQSLNCSEISKKKKYKLVENTFNSTLSSQTSVSATSSCLTQSAPEDRVEFLKVLRSVLTPADFSAFTAALVSYKRDDTFDSLMDLLIKLLGKPQLLYMLRGMRRFLKSEHKSKFDKRLSDFT